MTLYVGRHYAHPVKRILISLLLLCIVVAARADQLLSPEEAVRTLISAAHKDQLRRFLDTTDLIRIASHPRHAYTPEQLLTLLKDIPDEPLSFEVHRQAELTLIRLTAPRRLDFTVESRPKQVGQSEGKLVVVAVTP